MQSIHRYGFAESIFRQVAFIETTRQRGSSAIFFPQKIETKQSFVKDLVTIASVRSILNFLMNLNELLQIKKCF